MTVGNTTIVDVLVRKVNRSLLRLLLPALALSARMDTSVHSKDTHDQTPSLFPVSSSSDS
jgi:hypothetical protein